MTKTKAMQDPPTVTPPAPYRPASFQRVRRDIRELLTKPLQAWMLTPPAPCTATAYAALMTAPLDLAACGYTVTLAQSEPGWRIDARCELTPGSVLHLYGEARSYAAALYRLADMAPIEIDDLERHAKQRTAEPEGSATS